MTVDRIKLSIQTVKDNISIMESEDITQDKIDAGYYLQLEHEKFVLKSLEKQIPKPKHYHYEQNVKDTQMITVCPECKLCTITNINYKPKYCCWCGQALEWNEKGGAE